MGMVFWDTDPDVLKVGGQGEWDKISLDSIVLPGLALPNVHPKTKVDRRSPRGKHHGSIFDLGHELVEFDFTLRIYTEQEWKEWLRIKDRIDPTVITDEAKRYFAIYHPSLKDVNVNSVYLNGRSNWKSIGGDTGGGVKETKFTGYVIRKETKAADNGPAKPANQLKLPGNVFEDITPPVAPSKAGIYPSDK